MKFGLIAINVGFNNIQTMVQQAQLAEHEGFESVWTFEHVMIPNDYTSKYPYAANGKMGLESDTNFIDPLIALTAIAQHTNTLKLGTGVNILPQSNPLLLAKQAASLDFASNGRLILGLGIGWLEEEYKAMSTLFRKRGARFDDYLQAMRKVWSGETVEHKSPFLQWQNFKSYPIPAKHLPVHIGGSRGKAFERIARYGDGWFAPTNKIEQLEQLMPELQQACDQAQRDITDIEISAMFIPGMEQAEAVTRYAAQGVERLIVPINALAKNQTSTSVDKSLLQDFARQYFI